MRLDGGPGLDDVVDYGQRTTRDVINLGIISWNNDGGDENADSVSEECDDVFFSTENAIGGSGNDILSADFLNNQSDNEFTGGAGNDQMDGGAGNDIFHEGTAANGADAMEGNSGADLADYSGRSVGVTVSLNDGAGNDGEPGEGDSVGAFVLSEGTEGICGEDHPDFGGGDPNDGFDQDEEPFDEDEADDAPDNLQIENVAGGSGGDTLVGDAGANIVTGNAGNDNLAGGGGSDVITGGDGDDILAGNAGNDNLDGGAGTDWFDFQSAGAGGVGVQVNLSTGLATGEGADALTGGENVGGSSFADTIRGDAGNNVLNGRGGNDAIQGAGGDDVVNGGSGHDELNGNGGNDTVRGQSGRDTLAAAAVTMSSRVTVAMTPSLATMVMTPSPVEPARITSAAGPAPTSASPAHPDSPEATSPSAARRRQDKGCGRQERPAPTPRTTPGPVRGRVSFMLLSWRP